MKYLGIDYGSRHAGFAIGDDEMNLASPLESWNGTDRAALITRIEELVVSEDAEGIVVGVPYSGVHNGEQQEEVEEFIKELRIRCAVSVEVVDERFTSQEAAQRMKETGSGKDHSVAAMLILQTYLDGNRV